MAASAGDGTARCLVLNLKWSDVRLPSCFIGRNLLSRGFEQVMADEQGFLPHRRSVGGARVAAWEYYRILPSQTPRTFPIFYTGSMIINSVSPYLRLAFVTSFLCCFQSENMEDV